MRSSTPSRFATTGADHSSLFWSCENGRRDFLQRRAMSRNIGFYMLKRHTKKAGLPDKVWAHSFRATEITEHLRNAGRIEVAVQMAGHESTRITQLYNRLRDEVSLTEIEGIHDGTTCRPVGGVMYMDSNSWLYRHGDLVGDFGVQVNVGLRRGDGDEQSISCAAVRAGEPAARAPPPDRREYSDERAAGKVGSGATPDIRVKGTTVPVLGPDEPERIVCLARASLLLGGAVDAGPECACGFGRTLDVESKAVGLVPITGVSPLRRIGFHEVRQGNAHLHFGVAQGLQGLPGPRKTMEVHVAGCRPAATLLLEGLQALLHDEVSEFATVQRAR